MSRGNLNYQTIDEYIQLFPEGVQNKLTILRKTIHEAAPEANEKISYDMPTFYLFGNLIHFAAYEKHIGLYPGESGIRTFQNDFKGLKSSKGAVQFPINQELPLDLVRKIVKFRVQENLKLENERKNIKKK